MKENLDKELHRVAITAIINRPGERKFLITRRSLAKKAFPGKWNVPGGGLTIDDYVNTPPTHGGNQWYEVMERALRRELREEVNLEIAKPQYLCDLAFIRPDNVPVLVVSYVAEWASGEVKYDEDTIDHAWVTYEEAKGYDLLEGMVDELRLAEELLNKKN